MCVDPRCKLRWMAMVNSYDWHGWPQEFELHAPRATLACLGYRADMPHILLTLIPRLGKTRAQHSRIQLQVPPVGHRLAQCLVMTSRREDDLSTVPEELTPSDEYMDSKHLKYI
jgi:hypothetical protein